MAKVSVGVFYDSSGCDPTIICGENNIVNYLNELFDGTGEESFTLQDVRVITAYQQSRWFNRDGYSSGEYTFGPGWPESRYYHSFYILECNDETNSQHI